MTVILSAETQHLIEERMKQGGYATADDVVRAGLASLDRVAVSDDFEVGEFDALLAESERSGLPLDGEQVLAELRELRVRRQDKVG